MILAPIPIGAQEETPEAVCPETTPEENAALVEFYWQEFVWGNQGKLADVVAPDEVHHWGIGGDTTDFASYIERVELFVNAFPDLEFSVDLIAAEGDLVASYWTATASQTGEWQGIPPSNTEVSWSGINIFRFACGMIAESWSEADHFGLLQQLGATDLPPMMATPAETSAAAEAMAATPCADDTPEANTALALRWTEEAINGKNVDVLDEILAPAMVHHGASFPDAVGSDEVKAAISRLLQTFPDMSLTVDMTIASGDLVAVRWSGPGTVHGPWLGLETTGTPVDISGINIYRVQCGQIVEGWSESNILEQYRAVAAGAEATPTA
jgi:predicted ester cyclase